jgi:ABC-type multidrug transport system ATPase subunit
VARPPVLTVERLTKRYGARTVVDGVSFELAAGSILALLGPNGAGKTTVLKCMLGLARPQAGRIEICGVDALAHGARARAHVGFVPQRVDQADDATGRELLALIARLRGAPAAAIEQAAERTGASDELDRPLSTLSGGQLQRVVLAQALIGDPPVLVLDEPTVSLDPLAQHEYVGLLGRLREEGKALLLSSHLLSEVERVADEALVLDEGKPVGRWKSEEWRDAGLEALFLGAVGRTPLAPRAAS